MLGRRRRFGSVIVIKEINVLYGNIFSTGITYNVMGKVYSHQKKLVFILKEIASNSSFFAW